MRTRLLLVVASVVLFGAVGAVAYAATRSAPGLAVAVTLNTDTLHPGESGTATIHAAPGGRCRVYVHLQTAKLGYTYSYEYLDANGYAATTVTVPKAARTGSGLVVAHCSKSIVPGMGYAEFTVAAP